MRWLLLPIGLLLASPAVGQNTLMTGAGKAVAGSGSGALLAPALWDTTTSLAANWDFTLGNTKATCKPSWCGGGNQAMVSSTNPLVAGTETRKIYWEITPNFTGAPSSNGVGMISTERFTGGTNDLNGPGGLYWRADGTVKIDGGAPITLGTYTTGTILGFAYDFAAKNLWVRPGCAGLWNNNAGADPATGVGAGSLTGVWTTPSTVMIVAWDGFNGNANGATLNTGGTAFACTAPAGFVKWQ